MQPQPSPQVSAVFTIRGKSYRDVNPAGREIRALGTTIPGVRPPNANKATMHAEFSAMFQAYEVGIRGGIGILEVFGLTVCPYCRGDLKTLARLMGLERLKVVNADGTEIEFIGPQDLQPVKQGGKLWK